MSEIQLIKIAQAYVANPELGDEAFEKVAFLPALARGAWIAGRALMRGGPKAVGKYMNIAKKGAGRTLPGVKQGTKTFGQRLGTSMPGRAVKGYGNALRRDPLGTSMNTMFGYQMMKGASDGGRAYGYIEAREKLAMCVAAYHETDDADLKKELKNSALESLKVMGS